MVVPLSCKRVRWCLSNDSNVCGQWLWCVLRKKKTIHWVWMSWEDDDDQKDFFYTGSAKSFFLVMNEWIRVNIPMSLPPSHRLRLLPKPNGTRWFIMPITFYHSYHSHTEIKSVPYCFFVSLSLYHKNITKECDSWEFFHWLSRRDQNSSDSTNFDPYHFSNHSQATPESNYKELKPDDFLISWHSKMWYKNCRIDDIHLQRYWNPRVRPKVCVSYSPELSLCNAVIEISN